MTSFSVQKDPLLSGAMNISPLKPSPLNPPGITLGAGGMFGSQPSPMGIKTNSPTMMVTDAPEDVRGGGGGGGGDREGINI